MASLEEVWLAIRHGASALGFVSAMPSGPGVIPEELIAELVPLVPPGISTFLLTSLQDAGAIVEQHRRCQTSTIQICDRLKRDSYRQLRAAMPGIALVQVIHVTGEESVDEAVEVSAHVHGILLDSGNQSLEVKELGGTGRRHDWTLSRRIRELVNVPIFLAGGINAENVREAIETVGPFGIDMCSGLRTGGRLDSAKVSALFSQLRQISNGHN
jgi:phosphoribosylanthranilate isomerase